MAFLDPKKLLRSTKRAGKDGEKYRHGVFRFTDSIFGEDNAKYWKREMAQTMGKRTPLEKLKSVYKQWRTFQISDHFPMWIELKMDFSDGLIRR